MKGISDRFTATVKVSALAEIYRQSETAQQALADRDQALAERDQAIADRDQAVADRDQAVAELTRQLEQLEPYSHSRPEAFCSQCRRHIEAVCPECGQVAGMVPT